jgi:UDP-glucose-4-epimerase GalE
VSQDCILITGGAGYVGRHIGLALKKADIPFVVVDNFSASDPLLLPYDTCPYVEGDAGDVGLIANVCKKWEVTACFHLAGKTLVEESVRNPDLYRIANVDVTIGLIEGLKQGNVDKVIFSSSCAVFGDPLYIPIDEVHPQNPMSPYGLSKSMAEAILLGSGLKVGILRYFNAAGGELGEFHYPETHLIPKAVEYLMAGRPFEIYGNDYPTRDGTAIRDFVHVNDIAHAHLLALSYITKNDASRDWNIGTGDGVTVENVLDTLSHMAMTPIEKVYSPRRPGDPPMLVADNTRAGKELGWSPQITLAQAVKDALAIYPGKP